MFVQIEGIQLNEEEIDLLNTTASTGSKQNQISQNISRDKIKQLLLQYSLDSRIKGLKF